MANLSKSTVRIYGSNGKAVGSGFLISARTIITTAHVIGYLEKNGDNPQEKITLDFPGLGFSSKSEASIVFLDTEEDIAGLQLLNLPPDGAEHVPMVVSERLLGHSFKSFGFPEGYRLAWASGKILGPSIHEHASRKWLQVESSIGYKIQKGFSGSPVWDESLGGVIGMVVALDQYSNAAFLIPSITLMKKWIEIADKSAKKHDPIVLQKHKVTVFLSYAKEDILAVKDLYKKLNSDGITAWMDEEDLIVGQDWKLEIKKAIRGADAVIICLSKDSVSKSGYVQKEIRESIEVSEEKPEGEIFLIPARLDDCNVPDRLQPFHWADLFEADGYNKLLESLKN